LAEDGYAVDCVDNEPRFFDYIRKKTAAPGLRFIAGDVNSIPSEHCGYAALFFGEAIEHMAKPLDTLRALHARLAPGGLLCLTTPNGDYIDCTEPPWSEVAQQTERNARIANTIGNHVCEFRMRELKGLLQEAGFGLLDHELVCSKQISKRHILRLLPERWLWPLDRLWSKKKSGDKFYGRVQIVVARKFH
jgi:2-polyprenyl-3-methyl-5-hydroxy-6-metoxy-1,4-benzoquinol methylase